MDIFWAPDFLLNLGLTNNGMQEIRPNVRCCNAGSMIEILTPTWLLRAQTSKTAFVEPSRPANQSDDRNFFCGDKSKFWHHCLGSI